METHGIMFCNACRNMLYLKTECTDTEKKLIHYCKNCNETYNNVKESVCVFDIEYQNDANSHQYMRNDLLLYDPTLPRLNSMDCINPSCVSNQHCKYSITCVTKNESSNVLTDKINENVKQLPNYNLSVKEFQNKMIITVNDVPETVNDEAQHEIFQSINDYLVSENYKCLPIKKNKKDILFIKYDEINLKYLYKCCNCFTCWKNK